jgi:hypothetical protein
MFHIQHCSQVSQVCEEIVIEPRFYVLTRNCLQVLRKLHANNTQLTARDSARKLAHRTLNTHANREWHAIYATWCYIESLSETVLYFNQRN